jgi:transposase
VIRNGELFVIHELHQQGVSISAIARQTGLDRKTVRKYVQQGLKAPRYGPRAPRPQRLDAYRSYVRERVEAYPGMRGTRLLREIRALGYDGCYSQLTEYLREIRPPLETGFEHRFETAPGEQGQVDFAQFKTIFTDEPGVMRIVWLFSLVLGHSRILAGEFVLRQDLATVLRCHMAVFEELAGVPRQILDDRMKTAVLGEDETRHIIYHPRLLELAEHFGFVPLACAAYRAKTKGKVERPFSYVRDDFFLAGEFRNLEDLNTQYAQWRQAVANQRCHGTTGRIVSEAFAAERPSLQPLPQLPFNAVLSLQRRISHDGMVSVHGNFYSVPDRTRRRVVEVQTLADQVRIYEGRELLAVHPLLQGRGQRRVAAGHRRWPPPGRGASRPPDDNVILTPPGHAVSRRDLGVYDLVGQALAADVRP